MAHYDSSPHIESYPESLDRDEDGELVSEEELLTSSPSNSAVDASRAFHTGPRHTMPGLGDPAPFPTAVPGPARSSDVIAGRYLVERVVGRDGHEMVLLVRHVELGQRAVLRYLLPEACLLPDAVARFHRSAVKALESRSDHTERVIDYGKLEGGVPYRVAELSHGSSLEEILRVRGALPVDEAADTAILLCEALAEVHASRAVFRNLSAANTFVERKRDGTPIARLVRLSGSTAEDPGLLNGDELAVLGTSTLTSSLPYAAPEQFRNPGAVDARTDIYALGAVLFELLTGTKAFEADSPVVLISMIAADAAPAPSTLRDDLPEELDALVVECLQKDPESRPRSVIELCQALAPFSSPAVADNVDRVARLARRSTRPPARVSRPSSADWAASRPSTDAFRVASAFSARPSVAARASVRASGTPNTRRPASVHVIEQRPRSGVGMVAVGACLGVVAAIAFVFLNRPVTAAPAPPPSTTSTALAAPSPVPQPAAPTTVADAIATALPAAQPGPRLAPHKTARETRRDEPTTTAAAEQSRAAEPTTRAAAPTTLFDSMD